MLPLPFRYGLLRSTALALAVPSLVGARAPAPPPAISPRAARASPAATLESLAAAAARHKEAGRPDAAVAVYRQALAGKADWPEARLALATLLFDLRRFPAAREEFRHLARKRPQDGLVLALGGLCAAELGDKGSALAELLQARSLGISNREVLKVASYRTAVLLLETGDPDGAFEVLREFAQGADDRPPVIEAFGLAMLRLPLAPDGIPAEKREMILLAGRGGYHLARGRSSALGRLALEELVSRFPGQPNVHYALGSWLLVDEPQAAIDEFRRELTVSPEHHVAMIQIALAELKRGRAEEALPLAEKAVSLAANVPAGWLALAQAQLATGQAERAVPNAEQAVKLAPENPRLRLALVQAYDAAGRKHDAARERQEFLKLQERQPGPREAAAPPHTSRGEAP